MNLSDFPSLCLKVNFEGFSYYSADYALIIVHSDVFIRGLVLFVVKKVGLARMILLWSSWVRYGFIFSSLVCILGKFSLDVLY